MINSSLSDDNLSVVSGTLQDSQEEQIEYSLRPSNLSEIIGMQKEKQNLQIMIDSAKKRGAALDHILFHGPPGLGKTSLAMAVASDMGVPIHVTTGPTITKAGDLASIITSLENKSILFIDEVHRIRHQVEEILYPAMEDRAIDIIIGKGPSAKTLRLDLPEFTIVAATTRLSMLSAPLRNRFGVDFRVDYYEAKDLADIVEQKAQKLGVNIARDAAEEIATRSRMTARVAVRILKRVRDYTVVKGNGDIDLASTQKLMSMLDIDEYGLDVLDRRILNALHYKFTGKPVGLNTLAASVSEDKNTIEEVYEPYLLRCGLIERTPRGRAITATGIQYILKNPSLFDYNN